MVDDPRGVRWSGSRPRCCTLAGHVAAATCRFLLLVAEFDQAGEMADVGVLERRALAQLEVRHRAPRPRGSTSGSGARLESLPVMTEAFLAGQLSYSKVRAMTRVATPKSESDLVAVRAPRHLRRTSTGSSPASAPSSATWIPSGGGWSSGVVAVWCHTAEDGTGTLTVRGDPAAIGIILRASRCHGRRAPEAGGRARHAARREAIRQRWTSSARVFLKSPTGHAAPNTEMIIHADLETLAEREPGPGRDRRWPQPRPRRRLERLACDCGLRPR